MDFAKRSQQPELLDGPSIPFEDIRLNMLELNRINQWLGGHRITLWGFKTLLQNRKKITLVEIGCGGGDNLFYLDKWCAQHRIEVKLTGIDLNPDCLATAALHPWHSNPRLLATDYKFSLPEGKSEDILFSSLFCHHFSEPALVEMLRWMQSRTRIGFFINDLHRHPIAYYSIRCLTRFFSRSYLVKHDAPLSVRRALRKNEWISLLQQAGIKNYHIQWKWAFRWLIIVPSNG